LDKVKTLGGEYNQGALGEYMVAGELVGDVVEQYKAKAFGRKGVVFCVGINHSQLVCKQFNDAGIPAEHLDGTIEDSERKAILNRLHAGQTTIVTNANVLCEGWDEPTVSYVGLARPTKSLALYIQQAGRGLRICPEIGKTDCIIIDHANHVTEHGHILEERIWTLEGNLNIKTKKKKNYKECPVCAMWIKLKDSSCSACGYTYPIRTVNIIQADFVEKPVEVLDPLVKEYRALLRFAKSKGHKPGYAYFRLIDKYGQETVKAKLSYGASRKHQAECYYNV
jgi:superfamily II DNA or RNA helicase